MPNDPQPSADPALLLCFTCGQPESAHPTLTKNPEGWTTACQLFDSRRTAADPVVPPADNTAGVFVSVERYNELTRCKLRDAFVGLDRRHKQTGEQSWLCQKRAGHDARVSGQHCSCHDDCGFRNPDGSICGRRALHDDGVHEVLALDVLSAAPRWQESRADDGQNYALRLHTLARLLDQPGCNVWCAPAAAAMVREAADLLAQLTAAPSALRIENAADALAWLNDDSAGWGSVATVSRYTLGQVAAPSAPPNDNMVQRFDDMVRRFEAAQKAFTLANGEVGVLKIIVSDLLTALKTVEEYMSTSNYATDCGSELEQVRAIIAKVESSNQ